MPECNRFLDCFPELDLSEEDKNLFESSVVENALYHKKDEQLCLRIRFDKILSSEFLSEIEDMIKERTFKDHNVEIEIIPHFKLDIHISSEEVMCIYRDEILWELQNKYKDKLVYLLFKNSSYSVNESEVTFVNGNQFMIDNRGKKLISFIKDLLKERFDIDATVKLECKDMPKAEEQCFTEEIDVYKYEPKSNEKKQCLIENALIYGKNTDGKIMSIADLDEYEGTVVVRGCVTKYEEKKLKKNDKVLVLLDITDFSDSIYNQDVVFGADKIDNSKYVILVDDITSVITCSNNHISNAVCFMNSDCINFSQIEFLKSFKNVIIAFNDDNIGQEKSIRVLKLLAENDISTFVIKLDDVDLITALNDLQGRRLIINQIKTVAGI